MQSSVCMMFVGNTAPDEASKASASAFKSMPLFNNIPSEFKVNFSWPLPLPCPRKASPM